jgi:single-strand DNA-binding protein
MFMCEINLTTISGRLVHNPELRFAATGMAVASFCVAATHSYRDKTDQWKEEPPFVPRAAFARNAEELKGRLNGERLLVIGRLRTERWQKDGVTHFRLVLAQPTPAAQQELEPSENVREAVPF